MKAMRGRAGKELRARIDLAIGKYDLITGKYWVKYDPKKVTNSSPRIITEILTTTSFGVNSLLYAMKEPAGTPAALTGTLNAVDLRENIGMIPTMAFSELPEGTGTKIPYRVTLDNRGWLATITWEMPKVPGSPAGTWTLTFTYGTVKPAPRPPAKQLRPATAVVYETLNT
jgi:hypothetical protein